MKTTRKERIDIVNQIINTISEHGRYFFKGKFGVAHILEKNGRLYMFNEHNGHEMGISTKFGYQPKKWVHGGTLWGLTKDFKEYIITGKKTNGLNGYGGLYCDHWGYSNEDMIKIRNFAKELNYL